MFGLQAFALSQVIPWAQGVTVYVEEKGGLRMIAIASSEASSTRSRYASSTPGDMPTAFIGVQFACRPHRAIAAHPWQPPASPPFVALGLLARSSGEHIFLMTGGITGIGIFCYLAKVNR